MTLHPSQFPKRADGTRFRLQDYNDCCRVIANDGSPVALCPTRAMAEMVAAALEFQARDGETFILEQLPKP